MRISEYTSRVVEAVKNYFPTFPNVQKFAGEFRLESDAKLSFPTPALFIGLVSASAPPREFGQFNLRLDYVGVIVLNDLNVAQRDFSGWNYLEELILSLDSIIAFSSNDVMLVGYGTATKTDRPSPNSNAGYSYWQVPFTVYFRSEALLPRE